MEKKRTLLVGGWDYPWNSGTKRGVHFYENNEFAKRMLETVNVGTQVYDDERKIVYICEEVSNDVVLGKGYGGYIIALRLSDGKLLSRVRTYGCNPTHSAFDKERKYLVVAHHNEPSVDSTEAKTGCPINLYALNEDGSIGELKDRIVMKGGTKTQLHSIYCAPSGKFFVVNDCGGDAIRTLRIEDEKLIETCRLDVTSGYNPRYGAFHPILPIYYGNNERVPELSTYIYDENGSFEKIKDLNMIVGDEKPTNNGIVPASDLIMHPNGKVVYTALRKVDRIIAIALDEKGDTKMIQSVDCGGEGTRGLTIDKTGEHLYICNHASGEVSIFDIRNDGTVKNSGVKMDITNAANLTVADGVSIEDWPKGPMIPGAPVAKKK